MKILNTQSINQKISSTKIKWMKMEDLKAALSARGVEPVGTDSRGNLLWNEEQVDKHIAGIGKAREQALRDADKTHTKSVVTEDSHSFDTLSFLTDLDHRLYTLIHSEFGDTLEMVPTIASGNKEIFKSIQQLQKYVTDRLDTVETSILVRLERIERGINASATVGGAAIMHNPCGTPEPEKKQTAVVTSINKAQRKPHVGIVGVTPTLKQIIEREFGDAMKLYMLESSERNRIVGLKNCDVVFMLRGHVSSSHIDSLRKVGGPKPIEIGGGIEAVRDALTNFFVSVGSAA